MATKYWVGPVTGGNFATSLNWSLSSGGTGGAGSPAAGDILYIDGTSPSGTTTSITTASSPTFGSLYVSIDVAFTFSSTLTIANNLSLTTGCTWTSGAITFTGNGYIIANYLSCSISQSGGARYLSYPLGVYRYTISNGNFDLNGYDLTVTDGFNFDPGVSGYTLSLSNATLYTQFFYSAVNFNRTIAFGDYGAIKITGTATSFFNTSTGAAYITLTGSKKVIVDRNNSNSGTINTGATTAGNSFNFYFLSGTYALTMNCSLGNLYFINPDDETQYFSGSWTTTGSATILYGDLIFSPYMSKGNNVTSPIVFAGSATRNINSNGVYFNGEVNFNGAGGTFVLLNDINFGYPITHTNGTLDFKSYQVTCSEYTTAAGTKSIIWNGQYYANRQPKLSITGTGSTIIFNNTVPAGFSISAGYADRAINDAMYSPVISLTSATAKTFTGAGFNYAATISNDGAGALTITGDNTFDDITNNYNPTSFILPAGGTTYLSYGFTPYNATITSSTNYTSATVNFPNWTPSTRITGADYLTLRDIDFTPAPVTDGSAPYWLYGGLNSTNLGGVTGIALLPSTKNIYVIDDVNTSTWSVPFDWNPTSNEFFIFGGGGGSGGSYVLNSASPYQKNGGGGGGGGFTYLQNFSYLNSGNYIGVTVGAGGPGQHGDFNSSYDASGGASYLTVNSTQYGYAGGGGGGASSYNNPDTTPDGGAGGTGGTYNGGAGRAGSTSSIAATSTTRLGGGGGGAGGPFGNGGAGASTSGGGNGGGYASSGTNGGYNYQGFGGGTSTLSARAGGGGGSISGPGAGFPGSSGIDVYNTTGGGGGSGQNAAGGTKAYGAGAGSTSAGSTYNATRSTYGFAGASGAIIIVYNLPMSVENQVKFLQMFDIFEGKSI